MLYPETVKGGKTMTHYVTGNTIKALREKKRSTRRNNWLTGWRSATKRSPSGRPKRDCRTSLLEPLAKELGVSVAELLSGECITNRNRAGNMLRTKFYVCPVCGNVIHATGEGAFSCCGIGLPVQEAETSEEDHEISVEQIENDPATGCASSGGGYARLHTCRRRR